MLRFGYDDSVMRHLAILFIHLIVMIARLAGLGGARSVVAEALHDSQLPSNTGEM